MINYIVKKVLKMIPLMLILSVIIYGIIAMVPGDFVDSKANPNMSAERALQLKAMYGLDKPVTERYVNWLKSAVQGDFGDSLKYDQPVSEVIKTYVWNSFWLSLVTFILTLLIAIPIGIVSAVKQYSWFDKIATFITFIGYSFPSFFLGIVLMKIFAVDLGIAPISGMVSTGSTLTGVAHFLDIVKHMVLPVITMVTISIGGYVRYVRTSMLEVIGQDYIRTARAKGLKEKIVIYKHALRNALIPVVTFIGMRLPSLFGGAILMETVFGWPGIGKIAYESILCRDYTFLMGFCMFVGLLTVIGNLLSDVLYAVVDPRIKLK